MVSKIKTARCYIRLRYLKNEIKNKMFYKKINLEFKSNKPKIYIFLAGDYGNLGDIAITYAQSLFLKHYTNSKYEIIEIPVGRTYEYIKYIKKIITSDDIITIVGGGNMTNRYDGIEELRRMVIKNFKNNKIISFPQTMEFSNNILGKESLRRTKKIYNNHKNLYLFARERMSYEYMKKQFKCKNIYLVPDIVIFLKNKIATNTNNNEKIGICFRADTEVSVDDSLKEKILSNFNNKDLVFFDTHIGDENLNYETRYEKLIKFISEIANKKCIITDRLHGMIFSYITNTPCIALDNSNHKIKATYETWLSGCNYIKELDEKEVKSFKFNFNQFDFKDIDLNDKFEELWKVLSE